MNKLLKDKTQIIAWLNKYRIANYTLIKDAKYGYVVDVQGDVNLSNKKLTQLPIQFGKVSGYFDCCYNQLTSLEGGPTSVGGIFSCHNNKLTNLEGGPTSVGESFYCAYNQLTSLEGGPASVCGDFYCHDNQLTSLEGSLSSVGKGFYCQHNQLTSLEGGPTTVGGGFYCNHNKDLGKYQKMIDFNVIKEKLLSDKEKKALSESLTDSRLKVSMLKI